MHLRHPTQRQEIHHYFVFDVIFFLSRCFSFHDKFKWNQTNKQTNERTNERWRYRRGERNEVSGVRVPLHYGKIMVSWVNVSGASDLNSKKCCFSAWMRENRIVSACVCDGRLRKLWDRDEKAFNCLNQNPIKRFAKKRVNLAGFSTRKQKPRSRQQRL